MTASCSLRILSSILLFLLFPVNAQEIKGTVKVTVQADKPRNFLAPRALGISWDLGDGRIREPLMPRILATSGVTTLHYPAGNFAHTYHWSTNKTTGGSGYAQAENDFGHFAKLVEQFGNIVIGSSWPFPDTKK